ncbi:MAG: hypothetical protein OJF49_000093 [Ktedonobacterales bacterium]|nr:MAG: hypothetical protein OJF49_000093 [Ktedonobacterales bacterium]
MLAFVRNGQLWVIQEDGTQARELVTGGVAGYAWSPDHHQLVFRGVAQVSVSLPGGSASVSDQPGSLGVVSINGGFPLQITPGNDTVARSDGWWNADGNRLLYRETYGQPGEIGAVAAYIVSQADQPAGIARKTVLGAASLPVLSPDGKQIAVIDSAGSLLLGPPGSTGSPLAHNALLTLPQTNRPAHLLWRPNTDELVYPTQTANGVTLMDVHPGQAPRPLLTVPALLDAAFSPNGASLLVRTPQVFMLMRLGTTQNVSYSWAESDPNALPWWSPDGQHVLIHDVGGWQLVDPAHQRVQPLLMYDAGATVLPAPVTPAAPVTWRPATGSPWSNDGAHVVFSAGSGTAWQGAPLRKPHGADYGLYVASFANGGFKSPVLIDSGADSAASWSYLDPSTTFLVGT